MATQTGQNIGLINNYAPGDNGWSTAMNKMLRLLDTLVQGSVINSSTSAPPGSPAEGDAYIIAGSPTGAWSGFAKSIARWSVGLAAWDIVAPKAGWLIYDVAAATMAQYSGSAWSAFSSGGGGGSAMTVNVQTGTTYTPVLGDANNLITCNNASAITITIPTNASVAFPVGTVLTLTQLGAGQITLTGAGGVTINTPSSATARAQYSTIAAIQVAANTWALSGDLT